MKGSYKEKPCLLIIDMVKDNLDPEHPYAITPFAMRIVPPINKLISVFREKEWPVIFPTDAFHEEDFIFKGRMKPHSLAGTQGAEIAGSLDYLPGKDIWLPKPRFSAFFRTGLEKMLHEQGVTLCAVAGIATNVCILSTVLDALSHDFKVILLEDCTAAHSERVHNELLNIYRRNALYPLLRIAMSGDVEEIIK